jgi:hypothetical protein
MTTLPATVFENADVRLRVWFNDGVLGFQQITPDQRLASAPFALNAALAESVPDGSVTSAKIADGAITSVKLAVNAVQGSNIASGAVGSSQIAAGAVTNAQIAPAAITGASFATQARSGTLLDNLLDFATPGSVSSSVSFAPALNAVPTMSQTPGGWTFSAVSANGFIATAPFAPQTIDSTGNVGALTSLTVLASGRPAIAYFDTTGAQLKFAVAPNADGNGVWTAVPIGAAVTNGKISLAVIGGVPCVAFRNSSGTAFARCSTPDGSGAWTLTSVLGGAPTHMSLAEVDGRPAMSVRNGGVLNYAIAANTDGSGGWTNVIVDNVGNVGEWSSLAVVNGNPAISYRDVTNSRLKYVRANDVAGTTWGPPQMIDSAAPTGTFTSLRVVNGNPAISYFDALNSDLKYIRASDADGANWSAPITIDSTGTVGRFTSLAIVNGRPAISYSHTGNGDLRFAYASTADGSGVWKTVALDTVGNVGESTSLAVINGAPAISYYDITNQDLKYAAIPALNWSASEFGTAGPIASTGFSGNGSAITGILLSSVEAPPIRPVVAWGNNDDGQTSVPTTLINANTAAIAAGGSVGVALLKTGTVVQWGNGTAVPGDLADVTHIAAGAAHRLARKNDGTVTAWGDNTSGQSSVPGGLTTATNVAAGEKHSLALRADGTVLAWGDNTFTQTTVPDTATNVTAIAAGYDHSLALKADGTVVAWGRNDSGQSTVPDLTNVVAIAAGAFHSLAVKSDGTVVAWGWETGGQIDVPPGLTGVSKVAGGYAYSLALKNDGTLIAWGDNTDGQTVIPAAAVNVTAIAAGPSHALALRADLIPAQVARLDQDNVFTGKVGIRRAPAANTLEVEGQASKTTAGNWLANSDRRIKDNVKPITGAVEKLQKVRLVDFNYTPDYIAAHPGIEEKRYLNVIAQEFAEVFPEDVKSSGETLPDGSPILQVDTYPLTIYSAAAVQELAKENEKLKKQLAEQEARIKRIEAALQK